jgi:N-methylhydantoinase B
MTTPVTVDPISYEVFAHRLWAVGEEGRLALQQVSASPIVVQGGECMSAFYDATGSMVLACSGHLRFAAATSDAIRKLWEWYGESPGFYDGDQMYFNDPYVAGSHTYDQMVVAPIFASGELIAWTASSTHTADTGGLLRGGATEIFHEGLRIFGLKIVEKGEFREDVFRTLTGQCRDPGYVGLDLKSRIAANNVCIKGFLGLVAKLGKDVVLAAMARLLSDAEEQARARLRQLPDGTWRARSFTGAGRHGGVSGLVKVECSARKDDDQLILDFTGTSAQVASDMNSTLPSTLAHVSIALTNHLFWDVPWSDGKMRPIQTIIPEGSILNCTYPAACGRAPAIGGLVVATVRDAIVKLLYAGGRYEDVNAGWEGNWYTGGPGFFYGGHHRDGMTIAQGLYDEHGGGLGAACTRDGVNTGGHRNIPSGGISDVERIEMQYPFLYLARSHNEDGGGPGRFRGGVGSQRLLLVYGSPDCTSDYRAYTGIPRSAFGLFGGYPAGPGGTRALLSPAGDILRRLQDEPYPTTAAEAVRTGWATLSVPDGRPSRVALPEGSLVSDFVHGGGGFGDPLDREPDVVEADVRSGIVSPEFAARVYGVVLTAGGEVDWQATSARRQAVREDRLTRGVPPGGRMSAFPAGHDQLQPAEQAPVVLRFHEYLQVTEHDGRFVIQCRRCGHLFCDASENYKLYALELHRDLEEYAGHRVPGGEAYLGEMLEYACPGCATLLQTDVACAALGGESPLWDIALDVTMLAGHQRNPGRELGAG